MIGGTPARNEFAMDAGIRLTAKRWGEGVAGYSEGSGGSF